MDWHRSAIENLSFYEGVIVGAYTNWLVSFIDKLNVERVEAFRTYAYAEASISLILFASLIFYLFSRPRSLILLGIHVLSISAIIFLESIQFPEQNYLKLLIFLSLGLTLLAAIQATDNIRRYFKYQ